MLTHAATKSLLFNAPEPGLIASLMPAKLISHANNNIAVKHTEAAVIELRKRGFKAPSPIMSYYRWPGRYTPFAHQKAMAEFVTLHKKCFVLSEMGSAKTNAMLWAADWLMSIGAIRKVLVVAPLSTTTTVWQSGVFETLMHRQCAVAVGSRQKRMQMIGSGADFIVINPDGLKIKPIREAILEQGIDLIIVDEGAEAYRNSNTDRYRAMQRVINRVDWVWWMTGTPFPNGPDDAWAQVRLVAPHRVSPYYGTFRRQTMVEVEERKWVPRKEGKEIAYRAMQPAIRFRKDECLDLPPMVTIELECELSSEQTKAYDEMRKELKTLIGANEVTAKNAGVKLNRLRQILLGSIKIDEDYHDLDASPRLAVLDEAVKMAEGKVVVIVPFKGATDLVARHLTKGGRSVGIINGDVPISQRNRIVADFKSLPDPDTLVCHPQVMAHGLNLTEADVMIFYGPIFSNDQYRQVIERINRPGQKRKMTVVRIGANAMEWRIYKMPDTKEITQSAILDLYRNAFQEAA